MSFLIDSHVHVMPPARLKGLARWILRAFPDHPVSESINADLIVGQLKQAGVTHFFNFVYPLQAEETESLNQFNLEFCAKTPGAVPVASLHQDTPKKAALAESLFERHPFLGMKFHPFVQRFDPWDERMAPLYRFLEEIGRPVFFHTGFEAFYGMEMPIDKLRKLLQRYPKLPVVFVHMAFPEIETVFALLEEFPELTLDATNVLSIFREAFKPLVESLPNSTQVIDSLLRGIENFSERILFGSDHPVGMGALPDIYRDLETLPISDHAKENLSTETARRLVDRFLPAFDWSDNLQTENG